MLKKLSIACVCFCLAAGALYAQSDELIATARKTVKTYEKAVVSVATVVKQQAGSGGQEREAKGYCQATIIDPSGMAVTSLTAIQPKGRAMIGGRGIVEVTSEVQEAKYHLQDGTEIPVRIVLKDEDLDLAFLVPLKPLDEGTKKKIAAVPMGDAATNLELLDSVIVLKRGGNAQDYVPMVALTRVVALLSKPRTCYITEITTHGSPAFGQDGKPLGLLVRLSGQLDVLLPSAEVAKLVDQAKEEAKKPAEEKEEKADKKADEKKDKEE
jgi:hypothetical protein